MREGWTDERLDDGFDRIATDIAVLRGEVGSLRKEMRDEIGGLRKEVHNEIGGLRNEMQGEFGSLRREMQGEFGSLRADFAALQRTLLQVGGGVIVALIGIIVTQL